MDINVEMKNEEVATLKALKGLDFGEMFGKKGNSLKKAVVGAESMEDFRQRVNSWFLSQDTIASNAVEAELSRRIISAAYELALSKEEEKTIFNARKAERKLSNRTRYQMETTLMYTSVVNKQGEEVKRRWMGDTDLKAAGLMRLAVEHEYGGSETPPVFAIQNALPFAYTTDDDGDIAQMRDPITEDELRRLIGNGVSVSGGRIAWPKNSKSYEWLLKLFPKAIDYRAYNHSLNAPIMPGGYLPAVRVKLTEIMSENPTGEIVSAKTDGCGRIHPDHELFKTLDRPGGACTIQIRFINKNGTFAKGILVPDERCVSENGEPEIWFDWNQVKGSHKAAAQSKLKKGEELYTQGHIGVLQCWDRPRQLKWSFEQLQFIKKNPETYELVESFVRRAYKRELGGGVDSIIAEIAKENVDLDFIIQLVYRLNEISETEISPMQIEVVEKAVNERLQKKLYFIAQGAGIYAKQFVAAMDDGIPEGYVVAPKYKPGTKVVIHRFPSLLPQSIMTLTVMAPKPHHLINDSVVRNTVFMSPKDLTDKIQGDSDGDIVGLSNDPELLKLASHVIPDVIRLVEPEGEKFATASNSPEGEQYIMGNPMGNVGGMCLHQARLLAVGDFSGAVAMAFPYQEAVDSAKRKVTWTDFAAAACLEDWHCDENNRWHFNQKLQSQGDKAPYKQIKKWVQGRLIDFGVHDPDEMDPIAWRRKSKRINPKHWKTCEDIGSWRGGNLVHFSHDTARSVWEEYKTEFKPSEEEVELSNLLYKLLKANGHNFSQRHMTWKEYRDTVRTQIGIRDYAVTIAKILGMQPSLEKRQVMFDTAKVNLDIKLIKATVEDIELAWRMECTDTFAVRNESGKIVGYTNSPPKSAVTSREKKVLRVNNPTLAFKIVASKASPVLQAVGIQGVEEECQFLAGVNVKRISAIIDHAMKHDNPPACLIEIIHNSVLHEKECKDSNGHGIPGYKCHDCTTRLSNMLVASIRKERAAIEHKYIAQFVSRINKK